MDLAIIGVGCLFPGGANSFDAFWNNIKNKRDTIREVPPTHWQADDYHDADPKAPDHVYTVRGGFLEPIPFNPIEFGIAPNDLEATDTAQLLGLVAAQQALLDAGYAWDPSKPSDDPMLRAFDRSKVSVILGVTGTLELVIPLGARLGHPLWKKALRETGVEESVANDVLQRISDGYVPWQENSFPGLLGNVVAGRIANRLDLGGTNCVVDAACASSLSALHLAALELTTGRADMVLSGGIDTFNDIFMFTCFSKTPALSPTGDARPFDADGDGTILGEGLGVVALKRLADARRAGDTVYAILRGVGSSSDGKGNAIYAPKAEGQIEALRAAYQVADVSPSSIELVEAHGTGTRVGDATEVRSLTEVYKDENGTGAWCALGSVKAQIGHTKAAAGVAGLIKAVAALHHKVLPPTIKVRTPLDVLQPGASPFYANLDKRPWLASADHPRRAAVSSFGFGGSNFHCVLEEATAQKQDIDWDGDTQILAFSANSREEVLAELAKVDPTQDWLELSRAAHESRCRFDGEARCRLLLVVQRGETDLARFADKVVSLLRSEQTKVQSPDGIFYGEGAPAGSVGVLFPGQGAQYPGMLRDLACQFPSMLEVLEEASTHFADSAKNEKLVDRIYPLFAFDDAQRRANDDALRATHVAQPALGAVSLGAWRTLQGFGVKADAFAGHSYGELTALCAAGRLNERAFHTLSNRRGRLMAQSASQPGTMLAVRATEEQLRDILARIDDVILANKNAPTQKVLSGSEEAIARVETMLSQKKLTYQRLPVANAFHSPLVADAATPFRESLSSLAMPPSRRDVYANTTGDRYPESPEQAKDILGHQLAKPVEFVALIRCMYANGVRTFLEVGPGARLTGLVRSILEGESCEVRALDASSGKNSGSFDLACSLAWLASLGHRVDLEAWEPTLTEPAKTSNKPGFTVSLCGANYVKPREPRPASSPPPTPTRTTTTHEPAPMNGSTPTNESTAPPTPEAKPTIDESALSQALQLTRESLASLQQMQEQTAQLHRQFLEGQEGAQSTVHLLLEQQRQLVEVAMTGTLPTHTAETPRASVPAPPPVSQSPPRRTPPPVPAPTSPTPLPTPVVENGHTPPPPPVPPSPVSASIVDKAVSPIIEQTLLEVISEKTGYPPEMLELDMALDSDLGIDSIKRVEILSALQDRLPDAPTIKPEHLGSLHNLRQIVAFLDNGSTDSPAPPPISEPVVEAPPQPATPIAPPLVPNDEIERVLIGIVSEKTGYPPEMLELDMALDSDLGIDSIKRVEILSALQDRLPDAPTIKPEHLGTLQNLRQIVGFLSNGATSEASPEPVPEPEPVRPTNGVVASTPMPTPEPVGESKHLSLEVTRVEAVPLATAHRVSLAPFKDAELWITSDDKVLASHLSGRLQKLGYIPRLMTCAELRDSSPPARLSGLVILAPREPISAKFLEDALMGVQRLAPSLRKTNSATLLTTVSRLDGTFGLGQGMTLDPLAGGLAGLAKTAHHEWAGVSCKAIDLPAELGHREAAEALTTELFLTGPTEVGLSPKGPCTLKCLEHPVPTSGTAPVQTGDVVVLSGGARGVTAEVAVALASAYRPTLVLLGRTPLEEHEPSWLADLQSEAEVIRAVALRSNGASPREISNETHRLLQQREIRATLQRIREAGAAVAYREVDVRVADATANALESIRQELGPIKGLFHGAGVLADALIEDKTAEQFQNVFATKVDGLTHLLGGLDAEALSLLVLFSSTTARLGRRGQVDYAIANEVLNKTAQQFAAVHPTCRVVSANWGPWEGGMVTPALKKLFEEEGVGLIPLEEGADWLVRELRRATPTPVEVVVLGPSRSTAKSLPVVLQRPLSVPTAPVLHSHILDGRAVVPVALLLEWLAQAAMHQHPGFAFHGCENLQVLRGLTLEDETLQLHLAAGKAEKRDHLFVVPAELRSTFCDDQEILHTRAEVLLTSSLPSVPPTKTLPLLPSYTQSFREIYDRILFHGSHLQGIVQIEGCGPEGISAIVRPAPSPNEWIDNPLRGRWLADPLVLDCSFQMMILWTHQQLGGVSLPVKLGSYRQYCRAFPAKPIHVVATLRKSNELSALADIDYLSTEGETLARLEGYECAVDSNLAQAFRRNTLSTPSLIPS